MRINDLILESTQDEGVASALGGLSKGVGAVAGGIAGAGQKFAQGYRAGRGAVAGTSGTSSKANQLRMQADQLDGGNTAQAVSTTPQATTPSPEDNTKSLQTSIQHLKGADIERYRTMLQARAGVQESAELDELNLGGMAASAKNALSTAGSAIKTAYNKAAPVVGQAIKAAPAAIGKVGGAVRGAVTTAKDAYQQARGATMTPQDMQHAFATMTPQDAKAMLDYFNTIHPVTPTPTNAATTPAIDTSHPADDNANINLGQNESVGFSRFLGMVL